MITDEMIAKALTASHKIRRHTDLSGMLRMRAALEAVSADIRNAALEEAKSAAKIHGYTWSGSRDREVCIQEAAVDAAVDDIINDIEALKTKVTP